MAISKKERDRRELNVEDVEAQAITELPERAALSIIQAGNLYGALPVPVGRFADILPVRPTM